MMTHSRSVFVPHFPLMLNRAQKELVEKQKREEDQARSKRHQHADSVRAQIREKEQVRISERNAFFEEGVKLDEEARARRAKLEAIKRKKLNELRYEIVMVVTVA